MAFDWGTFTGSLITAGVQYNLGNKMTHLEEQREANRKAEAQQKRKDALAAQQAADAKYQAGVGQIYSGLMGAYGEDEDKDGKLDVVQNDAYYNTNVSAASAQNSQQAIKAKHNAYTGRMDEAAFNASGQSGSYADYVAKLEYDDKNPYEFSQAIDTSKSNNGGIYAIYDDEIKYTG